MGDVLFHSESSARKFGGTPEDYVPIHKFLDQSKLYIADWRHRALLHTTFGISLCEQMFGDFYTRPSDGVKVCTRTVATQHVVEDLGVLPTPDVFLKEMPIRRWMNGFSPAERKAMEYLRVPEIAPLKPDESLDPESDDYVGHNRAIELGAPCLCPSREFHCPYHGR